MKIDKQVRNISDRLDGISSSKHHDSDEHDDDYYIDIDSEPPRFLYYIQARAEKWEASGPHGPSEYDDTITQDELDYALKRRLRMTPEQRYQDEKRNFLFHDLSCYMRDLGEEDHGCTGAGCIAECRFYPEYGRIEDGEVIAEHKKLEDKCRKDNKIVDIPLPASKNIWF